MGFLLMGFLSRVRFLNRLGDSVTRREQHAEAVKFLHRLNRCVLGWIKLHMYQKGWVSCRTTYNWTIGFYWEKKDLLTHRIHGTGIFTYLQTIRIIHSCSLGFLPSTVWTFLGSMWRTVYLQRHHKNQPFIEGRQTSPIDPSMGP